MLCELSYCISEQWNTIPLQTAVANDNFYADIIAMFTKVASFYLMHLTSEEQTQLLYIVYTL